MSFRILRVNELIGQEVSKIISTELEMEEECFITVIKVDTTRDLKEAKVWVSIFPSDKKKSTFEYLKGNRGRVQFLLNRRLSMRPLPKITFKIDETEEEAAKIENFMNDLEKGKN